MQLDRRSFLRATIISAPALAAPNLAFGARPDPARTREIRIRHARTDETFTDIYYDQGEYLTDAMDTLDKIMRDFHIDEVMMMDVRLYDLLSELQGKVPNKAPIHITSAYRSKKTNDKLLSEGAARNSLHIQGMAADIYVPGLVASRLERTALDLKVGGVGGYRKRGFVHVDVGAVRHWTK